MLKKIYHVCVMTTVWAEHHRHERQGPREYGIIADRDQLLDVDTLMGYLREELGARRVTRIAARSRPESRATCAGG